MDIAELLLYLEAVLEDFAQQTDEFDSGQYTAYLDIYDRLNEVP
jgi:hypothetical protein